MGNLLPPKPTAENGNTGLLYKLVDMQFWSSSAVQAFLTQVPLSKLLQVKPVLQVLLLQHFSPSWPQASSKGEDDGEGEGKALELVVGVGVEIKVGGSKSKGEGESGGIEQ